MQGVNMNTLRRKNRLSRILITQSVVNYIVIADNVFDEGPLMLTALLHVLFNRAFLVDVV